MREPDLVLGPGEMGRLIGGHDWSGTPLGAPAAWPASLRSVLSVCLNSTFPMAIYWGPEMRLLYNDAWAPIPGERHPRALGQPAAEVWDDIWHIVGPQLGEVMETGRGFSTHDELLPMRRGGRVVESYWDYSFSPIVGEDGRVAGLFNEGQEVTSRLLGARRGALLVEFEETARAARDPVDLIDQTLAMAARYFGVGRAGYATIDRGRGTVCLDRCWTDGTMAELAGEYPLGTFGQELHHRLVEGLPYIVDDAALEMRLTEADRATYRQLGVVTGVVMPAVEQANYVAAIYLHDRAPRSWLPHHIETLRRLTAMLRQEVTRLRAELSLKDGEERYRLIFEQAQDMIFTADLDQKITAANPATARAVGLTPEQALGRSITEFLVPGDEQISSAMLAQKLARGGTTQYEVRLRTPSGEPLLLEVNSTLWSDADGRPKGLHGIARDITARRAFEQRQRVLIDELNHRVKNTLALVQGLALQSFRPDRDAGDAQRTFQDRLATLAGAHDLLTHANWEGVPLEAVVRPVLKAYDDPPGRLRIEGAPLILRPKAAVSMSLVVHELATNAARHGALSVPDGRVSVGWQLDETQILFRWTEEGGPPTEAPARRGFGLKMIERALVNDLAATVEMDFAPQGFALVVRAPREKVEV